ncbi:MAG: hypothetical protein R3F43_22215 [bacterium]
MALAAAQHDPDQQEREQAAQGPLADAAEVAPRGARRPEEVTPDRAGGLERAGLIFQVVLDDVLVPAHPEGVGHLAQPGEDPGLGRPGRPEGGIRVSQWSASSQTSTQAWASPWLMAR